MCSLHYISKNKKKCFLGFENFNFFLNLSFLASNLRILKKAARAEIKAFQLELNQSSRAIITICANDKESVH